MTWKGKLRKPISTILTHKALMNLDPVRGANLKPITPLSSSTG